VVTRRLWLYHVTMTSLVVPEWAQRLQPPEFDREQMSVWCRRGTARILAKMDREDGGSPVVLKVGYRRCALCKRLRIQVGAQQPERPYRGNRRKNCMLRGNWYGELQATGGDGTQPEPCGPDCVAHSRKKAAGGGWQR
jgi:hypothetical protein